MNVPVLSSRIDSVTVYRQGALVCRTALLLAAQPVPAQVRLLGLPLSLEDGSVRVRIEGEAGELPVATDVRVALDLAAADETLPPPDDEELKQARRRVRALADRRAHLQAQRQRLERLQVFERPANKRGQPPQASPVAARLSAIEFQHASIAAIDEQLAQLRVEERRAEELREHLEHRRKAASRARQAKPHELRKAALVSLRAREIPTAPVRLFVEYMVPGARWAPAYAVKLARDMSQATVSVRAVVAQDTGEDWGGVRLTLATADAQRWVELPEIQALRIGRRQPPVARRGWRAPPAGALELYGDYDRFLTGARLAPPPPEPAAPEPAPEAEFDEEEVDGGAFDQMSRLQEVVASEAPAAKKSMTRSGMVKGDMGEMARRSVSPPRPSAPPPPSASFAPPGGAPMPLSAAPMAAQARARGGLGNAIAGAGGALAGAVGSLFGGVEGGGGGPQGFARGEPLESDLEASPEQLAYGDLRMPGASAIRRGALTVTQRRERYLEMLWVREVTKEIDVVALIDGAVRKANQAGGRGLPPRHRLAESWFGFDYVYAAESPVDIPSDGDFHGVPLTSRTGPVELGYVVVPRESTDVFRFVKLKNPLDAPLLPGPADIYVGGDYLLSADLKVAPPRGEVKIGLGVEQAIKVSRNTHYKEEAAGLMGGTLALRHELILEVANRRDRPVEVEVQERIPSLRDKEDEVQLDIGAVEPAWAPFEPDHYALKGGYRWKIQVPAGQKQKLSATYVIRISAKKELVGGNRRE